MAVEIIACGVAAVALVLAVRVKREDIPELARALSRWFRPRH
jgi:hypothetical protein